MNGIFNFVRFITYTVTAMTVRKGWNWLTADVDPIPGTKEFNTELLDTKTKYFRLKLKKEEYDEAIRKVRRHSD
jgi:hypothetical protein